MPTFKEAMAKSSKDFSVLQGDNEALQYYLTHNKILKEMVPLWSKSTLIRAGHEGNSDDPKQSKLVKQAKNPLSLYINVDRIREHYGDETAIYFEWMNYFQ